MSRTREDVERMLEARERRFELLDDGTIVMPLVPGQAPAMLRVEPPVIVMQVTIGEVKFSDAAAEAAFYRKLLEHNAQGLLHAAYGLEGERVVLIAALALDNLDPNELEAALADLGMALVEHVPGLRHMVSAAKKG